MPPTLLPSRTPRTLKEFLLRVAAIAIAALVVLLVMTFLGLRLDPLGLTWRTAPVHTKPLAQHPAQ